jgi:hypothetical protein
VIVSISQPAYLPWAGYFDRIAASDLHVVLDDVQFEKNSYINRNKLRTAAGWCWVTVPVSTAGAFGDLPISDVRIAEGSAWCRKHCATIEQNYRGAPHYAPHRSFLLGVYDQAWGRLLDVIDALTRYLLVAFGITTPIIRASSLATTKAKGDLVLEICQRVGAAVYLSGPLGRDYLDEAAFAAAGVQLVYRDYKQPVYRQAYPGFEPYMSAVDLLFNHGDQARAILQMRDDAAAPTSEPAVSAH